MNMFQFMPKVRFSIPGLQLITIFIVNYSTSFSIHQVIVLSLQFKKVVINTNYNFLMWHFNSPKHLIDIVFYAKRQAMYKKPELCSKYIKKAVHVNVKKLSPLIWPLQKFNSISFELFRD